MSMRTFILATVLSSTGAFAAPPGSIASLVNETELREKLGVPLTIGDDDRLTDIRIAILDYGFAGIDPASPCLPSTAELVEHYDPDWIAKQSLGDARFQKSLEAGNPHGRQMAQAVWSITGRKPAGPKFFLLNANGPTLFRRAVRYAIERQVHIILLSGHFEGGGNFDGLGNINRAVDEAVKAGIVWINAAGNHHGRVYNGPIRPDADGYVRFGTAGGSTILPFTNRLDENTMTITLTWNDYRDREDAGTTKDLDLIIEDGAGQRIAASELKQIADSRAAGDGESKNPRERLTIPNLARGTYRIRVRDKCGHFTANDRMRILLMPSRGDPYPHPDTNRPTNPIDFPDASNIEELFPPADHARVITVGELSGESAAGPTADRRLKPDLLLPAVPARWSNGEVTGGTSYAAAYFTGIVALRRAVDPTMSTNDWMKWFAIRRKSHVVQKGQVRLPPKPAEWKSPSAADWATIKSAKP
jgi:hypothetical protein